MKPRILVYNGWAAGRETWSLCAFPPDFVFSYLEEMDGVPDAVIPDFDRVVLVGFSMGGTMALKSYLKFPDRVAGLVLVSTTACMMEHPEENWRGMSLRRRQALYLGTRALYRDDPSPLYRNENLRRGLEFLRTADVRAPLRAFAASGGTASLPVAVVQSEHDGFIRPGNMEFFREVFPRSRVTWIPGNEHNLPVAAPEAVDRAVSAVLSVTSTSNRRFRG